MLGSVARRFLVADAHFDPTDAHPTTLLVHLAHTCRFWGGGGVGVDVLMRIRDAPALAHRMAGDPAVAIRLEAGRVGVESREARRHLSTEALDVLWGFDRHQRLR
jgi:hypothetical protein